MTTEAHSPPTGAPATPSPPDRLAIILDPLRAIVARDGLATGLAGPLINLIVTRLNFLIRRFAAHANSAPRSRKPDPLRDRARTGAKLRLPRRFAFLLRAIPASATARAQLRDLLAAPDTVALIESRPTTGRALRPLCHLLGIKPPPFLRLPRKPRTPRPKPEREQKKQKYDPLTVFEPRPDIHPNLPRLGDPMRFFPRRILRRRRRRPASAT